MTSQNKRYQSDHTTKCTKSQRVKLLTYVNKHAIFFDSTAAEEGSGRDLNQGAEGAKQDQTLRQKNRVPTHPGKHFCTDEVKPDPGRIFQVKRTGHTRYHPADDMFGVPCFVYDSGAGKETDCLWYLRNCSKITYADCAGFSFESTRGKSRA